MPLTEPCRYLISIDFPRLSYDIAYVLLNAYCKGCIVVVSIHLPTKGGLFGMMIYTAKSTGETACRFVSISCMYIMFYLHMNPKFGSNPPKFPKCCPFSDIFVHRF